MYFFDTCQFISPFVKRAHARAGQVTASRCQPTRPKDPSEPELRSYRRATVVRLSPFSFSRIHSISLLSAESRGGAAEKEADFESGSARGRLSSCHRSTILTIPTTTAVVAASLRAAASKPVGLHSSAAAGEAAKQHRERPRRRQASSRRVPRCFLPSGAEARSLGVVNASCSLRVKGKKKKKNKRER